MKISNYTMVIASIAVLIAGCDSPPHVNTPLIAGFDASGSARGVLGTGASCLSRVTGDLGGSELTLYRFDNQCFEFFDGPAPDGGESLMRILKRELYRSAAHGGTRASGFWTVAASRVAATRSPIVVVAVTDGDDDDQTPEERRAVSRAARKIASNPQAVVAILGIAPANRAGARQLFSPMASRLRLFGPLEVTRSAIDEAISEAAALPATKSRKDN